MNDAVISFELTRLQILNMQAQRQCFPDAYAHAWNHRIYPVLKDQPRDRAYGDGPMWYLDRPKMLILERWLTSLPGFQQHLDGDSLGSIVYGETPQEAKGGREAVVEMVGRLGGFWALVEACRYYRMLGYGTPAAWEVLARASPDLAGVTRDVAGVSEFRY